MTPTPESKPRRDRLQPDDLIWQLDRFGQRWTDICTNLTTAAAIANTVNGRLTDIRAVRPALQLLIDTTTELRPYVRDANAEVFGLLADARSLLRLLQAP